MPITNTLVGLNCKRQLEIVFTADSKSYDWSEKQLASLIDADSDVATAQVSIERTKRTSTCTVQATPAPGTKFRSLSIAIRTAVADTCSCDLGEISFNEAYDRLAKGELSEPEVAPASDVGMFDERMSASR